MILCMCGVSVGLLIILLRMVIVFRLICIIVKKLFGWVCSERIWLVLCMFFLDIILRWILCEVVMEILV